MAGVTRRASLAVLWLALTPLGAAAWMQELFVEEETLLPSKRSTAARRESPAKYADRNSPAHGRS